MGSGLIGFRICSAMPPDWRRGQPGMLPTFFVRPKKVGKEMPPRCAIPCGAALRCLAVQASA